MTEYSSSHPGSTNSATSVFSVMQHSNQTQQHLHGSFTLRLQGAHELQVPETDWQFRSRSISTEERRSRNVSSHVLQSCSSVQVNGSLLDRSIGLFASSRVRAEPPPRRNAVAANVNTAVCKGVQCSCKQLSITFFLEGKLSMTLWMRLIGSWFVLIYLGLFHLI